MWNWARDLYKWDSMVIVYESSKSLFAYNKEFNQFLASIPFRCEQVWKAFYLFACDKNEIVFWDFNIPKYLASIHNWGLNVVKLAIELNT